MTFGPDVTMKEAADGGMTMKAAAALLDNYKATATKAVALPPTNIYTHGEGGLFQKAAQQQVFSALLGLRDGFESTLRVRPNRIVNPSVHIITGIEAVDDTGGSPGDCGDFPMAGKLKKCTINDYPYGYFGLESDTLNIALAGERADRGDFDDYQVAGTPFGPQTEMVNVPSLPGFGGNNISGIVNNDGAKLLFEFAYSLQLFYGRTAIYANPADNDASVNPIEFFRGLDLLINDNYSDLVSGADCDRVDSLVLDFEVIAGTSPADALIETFSNEIVRSIVETVARLNRRHRMMGFGRRWNGYLLMHYNLFRQLVFLWAATYYSYRTALNTSNQAQFDGFRLVQLMNDMLEGGFLIGDEGNIPVVTDQAIIEDVVGPVHTSTIYFVNTQVNTTTTTYEEYFPFNMDMTAQGMLRRLGMGPNDRFRITDNGRFLTHFKPPANNCIQMMTTFRSRVRLDTPWLCGRIDNVSYQPLPFAIDETPFPDDVDYLDGGTTGPLPGARGTVATISACGDNAPGDLTFTLDVVLNCTLGTNVIVIVGNTHIPGVISAGNNSTSVTVDFTTVATPVVLQAIVCADFTFVGATIQCNF